MVYLFRRISVAVCAFLFIAPLLKAQPKPTLPSGFNRTSDAKFIESNGTPTFSKDGVWHKNMELIAPVNFANPVWAEQFQAISIGSGHYVITPIIDLTNGDYLLITDVTNPRSHAG